MGHLDSFIRSDPLHDPDDEGVVITTSFFVVTIQVTR